MRGGLSPSSRAIIAAMIDFLPPPALPDISFENEYAALRAGLLEIDPEYSALFAVETDPVPALLQAVAYNNVHLVQRSHDMFLQAFVQFATGDWLDALVARLGVVREVLDEGDASALPPIPPTMESDEDLRGRYFAALARFSTAGAEESYIFYGLLAAPGAAQIAVHSPVEYQIELFVLAHEGRGVASQALLDQVYAGVTPKNTRPMGDQVVVKSARVTDITLAATLHIKPRPDAEVIRAAAEAALRDLLKKHHRIGATLWPSAVIHALHQSGVEYVTLQGLDGPVSAGYDEAFYLSGLTVEVAHV